MVTFLRPDVNQREFYEFMDETRFRAAGFSGVDNPAEFSPIIDLKQN